MNRENVDALLAHAKDVSDLARTILASFPIPDLIEGIMLVGDSISRPIGRRKPFGDGIFGKTAEAGQITRAQIDIDQDITLYIKSILRENPNGGPSLFLREDVVENLTRLSDGLFVYTSTVAPFLAHAGYDAAQIYDDLVKSRGPWRMCEKLDDIYRTVLKIALEDLKDDEKHMRQAQRVLCWLALYRFQDTVGYSLHGAAYLSAEQLEFVDIPTDITLYVMDRLRSILTMEGQLTLATELRTSHSSFAHFIVDPKRCRDPLFYVGTEESHKKITLDLLAFLSREATAMLWSNNAFVGMLKYAFF